MGDKKEKVGPIVILHGWTYSIEMWEPFLKILEEKSVDYEVLKIPGLTAPLSRVWTLDDYESWLAQQVTSHKSPVVILGHSNGGRIAAAFAGKYPQRISKLILIDSAGIIHRNFNTVLKKTVLGTAAKIGKRVMNSDSIRNLFYRMIGEQDYNMADPILKKTMVNLISQDLTSIFSRIKVPTLITWGQDDTITPLSDGRKINELISNSRLEVIENAKHSPQFTHPNVVAEIILKFLAISH